MDSKGCGIARFTNPLGCELGERRAFIRGIQNCKRVGEHDYKCGLFCSEGPKTHLNLICLSQMLSPGTMRHVGQVTLRHSTIGPRSPLTAAPCSPWGQHFIQKIEVVFGLFDQNELFYTPLLSKMRSLGTTFEIKAI